MKAAMPVRLLEEITEDGRLPLGSKLLQLSSSNVLKSPAKEEVKGKCPTEKRTGGARIRKEPTKAVCRRNERERNRVKQVNLSFDRLRSHVPPAAKNKKLSKMDTLRSAVAYIKYLRDLLGSSGSFDQDVQPPFIFNPEDDPCSPEGSKEPCDEFIDLNTIGSLENEIDWGHDDEAFSSASLSCDTLPSTATSSANSPKIGNTSTDCVNSMPNSDIYSAQRICLSTSNVPEIHSYGSMNDSSEILQQSAYGDRNQLSNMITIPSSNNPLASLDNYPPTYLTNPTLTGNHSINNSFFSQNIVQQSPVIAQSPTIVQNNKSFSIASLDTRQNFQSFDLDSQCISRQTQNMPQVSTNISFHNQNITQSSNFIRPSSNTSQQSLNQHLSQSSSTAVGQLPEIVHSPPGFSLPSHCAPQSSDLLQMLSLVLSSQISSSNSANNIMSRSGNISYQSLMSEDFDCSLHDICASLLLCDSDSTEWDVRGVDIPGTDFAQYKYDINGNEEAKNTKESLTELTAWLMQ